MNKFKGKNILILGLARSGLSGAKLLLNLGANIIVNDAKPLRDNPQAQELINMGIKVITGEHPDGLVNDQLDYLVKNPGIPYTNKIVKEAQALSIPIITEAEAATSIIPSSIVAVTGTNGKTTTVSLVGDLLSKNRKQGQCFIAGNIGIPASEIALKAKVEDDVLLEMSSFQLMATQDFHPNIAVITNIYSAHLDYHASREEYVLAKMKITANQTPKDYLVYFADQDELSELVLNNSKAQLVPYSLENKLERGAYLQDERIYYNQEFIMGIQDIQLNGLHNLQNILAAVCVAKLKGLDNSFIEKIVNDFKGVDHRSQVVRRYNDRIFVNDSKATNTLATQKALEGFDQDLVLIVGGLDRKENFDSLNNYLKNVQAVVTFGQTKDKLAKHFKDAGINQVQVVETVSQAVPMAYELSKKNDVILFSPACASWDQYPNFETRGEDYIQAIDLLINKVKD